jgi:quinol monooxygenase YgiN
MNNRLRIVTILRVKPEFQATAREYFLSMIEPSRAEDGCLSYELFEHKENQNVFFFLAEWASVEHHDRHMEKPKHHEFRENLEKWCEGPPKVNYLDRISD